MKSGKRMNLFDLTGRVAIVTGGNGGIGLGMAEGLAAAGATVVLAGRSATKGAAAVKQITGAGGKAEFADVDVTDEKSCSALVAGVARQHGKLNILVNNAGVNIRTPPDALSLAEWRTVIDTNLTSAFVCSHADHPHMKTAGGGRIINIGSMMSIFAAGFAPAYAASKGGIVQFGRACATAWAKDNIQVNAMLPGWIDTDLTKNARREVEGLHERVLARTPAARWGLPADFAGIAVFLASAASDFVTGTAIPVDGGFSVQG